MLPSIFSTVREVWKYFHETTPIKTDDEYLQDCVNAFESDVNNSQTGNDFENLHDKCSKSTGKVTQLFDDYGVIDDKIQFSLESCNHLNIKLNNLVCYLSYVSKEDNTNKVVKILSVLNTFWEPDEIDSNFILEPKVDEDFSVVDRIIIGKVVERESRIVIIEPNDIRIHLDKVISNFIPIVGDWVEVFCKVQQEKDISFGNDVGEVLEVTRISPVRSSVSNGKITKWNEDEGWGIIDGRIHFTSAICDVQSFKYGDEVIVDAIESDQGTLSWRALSIYTLFSINSSVKKVRRLIYNENKNGIIVEDNINFGDVEIQSETVLTIKITNNSEKVHYFINAKPCSNEKNSQIIFVSENNFVDIKPGESMNATFKCKPKFIGRSTELFSISFMGFDIKREFHLNVFNEYTNNLSDTGRNIANFHKKTANILENIRSPKNKKYIPGIRPTKPPPFIKLRAATYHVPHNIMNLFEESMKKNLKGSMELEYFRKEISFPEMLTKDTYSQWFHNLLYIEEIQNLIRYKMYDAEKVWMSKESDYLRLDIDGLCDRRPSLLIGDSVKVTNPWGNDLPLYEGFIHKVNSDSILLRFALDFHRKYNGEDVSINFYFSRASFQKCHFAVDLTLSHLGPSVLFPDKLILGEKQVLIDPSTALENSEKNSTVEITLNMNSDTEDKTESLIKRNILWFNKKLNHIQKKAVINILLGVARPMPYVIFGPPGTGKTVTLIEVIMQLVCLVPSSRLLIATPSNSAANLLTERLITSGRFDPGSLIRLVAVSHATSGNLPDHLKPFCATLNVSIDNTNKSKFYISPDGMRHECNKGYLGRHRITIGTCVCLGTLVRMGFPAGHFTHIIVDEAGQATEPEIMIPLAFTDKTHGQIILAGDPMQLGPVVLSHVAKKLGLNESYLERLLNCFPYKKDFIGHGNENSGYDPRLVTKLLYNYRSIQSIIDFSSKTFYNSEIISKIDMETEETSCFIKRLTEVLNVDQDTYSGMVFHGVRGNNNRKADDPSWYNPQEAATALIYICKLYKYNFTPNEIAIISPYIQQVRYLRTLIQEVGCINEPKMGTVEELQGQERKIIILTTVRSHNIRIHDDAEKYLGFITQPKRVNVALTRAQYLLIIIGNPHILCLDPTWRDVLRYVVSKNSYIGCDLPAEFIE